MCFYDLSTGNVDRSYKVRGNVTLTYYGRVWKLENNDFRIDLVISRGMESETVTLYREAEPGETLEDVVREVYEAFQI